MSLLDWLWSHRQRQPDTTAEVEGDVHEIKDRLDKLDQWRVEQAERKELQAQEALDDLRRELRLEDRR